MKREKRWDMPKILNKIADLIELAIAFTLVAGIVVLFVQLVFEYGTLAITEGKFNFSDFLSQALNLIIGIEFTRMLCRHTPDTIIDVLLFATARYLIIDHSSPAGTFLGVLSIGVLFIIRKHMMPKDRNDRPTNSFMRRRALENEPTNSDQGIKESKEV
jgi:uncharacterized membrane protein (DUF373 family)